MRKFFRFVRKMIRFGIICTILLVVGVFIYIKVSPIPEIYSANNLTLLDNEGEAFFKGNESKEWVSLDEISNYVVVATINTEDKSFYKHHGFDIKRIINVKPTLHNILDSGKLLVVVSSINLLYHAGVKGLL